METAQQQKYENFKVLHDREGALVMPNPWDVGSAMIL